MTKQKQVTNQTSLFQFDESDQPAKKKSYNGSNWDYLLPAFHEKCENLIKKLR